MSKKQYNTIIGTVYVVGAASANNPTILVLFAVLALFFGIKSFISKPGE